MQNEPPGTIQYVVAERDDLRAKVTDLELQVATLQLDIIARRLSNVLTLTALGRVTATLEGVSRWLIDKGKPESAKFLNNRLLEILTELEGREEQVQGKEGRHQQGESTKQEEPSP